MEKHFQGSVVKNPVDNPNGSLFGVLSDIQDSDDRVVGLPPLDQLDADAGAAGIKVYDGDSDDEAEEEPTAAPEHDAPSGGSGGILGADLVNFNTVLKQYNPRAEFHKLGDTKVAKYATGASTSRSDVYMWRIMTINGKPDVRSVTVKQNGKNVTYSFAYCDWIFSYTK